VRSHRPQRWVNGVPEARTRLPTRSGDLIASATATEQPQEWPSTVAFVTPSSRSAASISPAWASAVQIVLRGRRCARNLVDGTR
jgi:hypothetical protein